MLVILELLLFNSRLSLVFSLFLTAAFLAPTFVATTTHLADQQQGQVNCEVEENDCAEGVPKVLLHLCILVVPVTEAHDMVQEEGNGYFVEHFQSQGLRFFKRSGLEQVNDDESRKQELQSNL